MKVRQPTSSYRHDMPPSLIRNCWPGALSLLAALLVAGCGSSGSMARPPQLNPDEVPKADATLTPMRGINSGGDDFGLTMPLDTTLLFFTSSRGEALGKHSIFFSRRGTSGWGFRPS